METLETLFLVSPILLAGGPVGVALRFPPRLVLVSGFLCAVLVGVFFLSSWSSCKVLGRVLPLGPSDVLPLVGVFESLSGYTVGKKLEALAVMIKYSIKLFNKKKKFPCQLMLTYLHMSRLVRKPTMWFPYRSDTNQVVQAQKMARDW